MALQDFDITGMKVLITGAGRGIGKGIALAMAQAGADVAVTALSQANADRVAQEVARLGRRGLGVAADATKLADSQRMAEQVLAQFGRVDVLINCVGDAINAAVAPLPDRETRVMTEADWHAIVDVNLTQAFVGCKALGPHLLERRQGCVINISSFAALQARAAGTAYAAAKAGLTLFTSSLALEWAPYGIRVNAIAPGYFADPEQSTPEELRRREERFAPLIPLRRLGQTREVGLMAVFLASPAAAYVTGQTFFLDGGLTIT